MRTVPPIQASGYKLLLRRSDVVVAAFVLAGAALAQPRTLDLDTPFVTTPTNVVNAMLDVAKVGTGDSLIDLGSGDGRIVIEAAKRGANAVGIEIDPVLVERSRALAKRDGVEARARFIAQDLFDTDFSRADVVTMYLLPDVNAKLSPKLFALLRPGARIVSHDYDLGGWPPDVTLTIDAPDKPVNREKTSRVYFWVVPARIDGVWRGDAGGKAVEVEFRQIFQHVSGRVRWAGREFPFERRKIEGERLALDLAAANGSGIALSLRADRDRLAGTLREDRGQSVEIALHR